MLNVIWLVLIVLAVLVAGFTGRLAAMTKGAFAEAENAVMGIALPLIGLWAIWLGMMRLAERAGLVQILARALQPVMRRLFPEVPRDHPAQGAMVLNMAANMLGLSNAATPLGLRAMALLQKLNPHKGIASNSMVTFLAVNTASIQLVPTTAISILAVHGSADPSAIVVPAFLATVCAMTCGIAGAKFFSRLPIFAVKPDAAEDAAAIAEAKDEPPLPEIIDAPPMTPLRKCILVGFLVTFFAIWLISWMALAYPNQWTGFAPADLLRQSAMLDAQNAVPADSLLAKLGLAPALAWAKVYAAPPTAGMAMLKGLGLVAVPFLLSFFPLYAALRRVKVYEQFCEGAKEAFATAQRVIPFLVAMLLSIRMLREAGVIQYVTEGLRPMLDRLGFPADLLPLALMRPLSGSASSGILNDIVKTHGTDSPLLAQMAATIYGSTETTFYVIAVYFGSVAIRKSRHAVLSGLIADFVALIAAIFFCRLLLGGS